MINNIGTSATNSYLRMRLSLQPGVDFQHPCRMEWIDKDKDYSSLPHTEWCDLLYTMEEKYNPKQEADQIKILAASKAAPAESDSDTSPKVSQTNKSRTSVLLNRKNHGKNPPKKKRFKRYCVLYKKYGITERKYTLQSLENCFGRRNLPKKAREEYQAIGTILLSSFRSIEISGRGS